MTHAQLKNYQKADRRLFSFITLPPDHPTWLLPDWSERLYRLVDNHADAVETLYCPKGLS